MIGFNGERVRTKSNLPKLKRTSPIDNLCALDLLKSINPRKRWNRPSIRKEAHHFRLMREQDHIEPERLLLVLEHHCTHLRSKYQPRAFCGKSFRSKYPQIEAAFERAHPPELDIEISDKAKDILKRLRMMGWKKGSLDHLPVEVQLSLNFVQGFRAHLAEMRASTTHRDRLYVTALADRLPRNWVERHYERLHKQLHNWDAWSGNLESFRMSIESKPVTNLIYSILQEYGGQKSGRAYASKIIEAYDAR